MEEKKQTKKSLLSEETKIKDNVKKSLKKAFIYRKHSK